MACATLKRSLEFDPVHSHGRPSKRRRCVPMCVSPGTSSQANSRPQNPSPFGEITHKLTPGNYYKLRPFLLFVFFLFPSFLSASHHNVTRRRGGRRSFHSDLKLEFATLTPSGRGLGDLFSGKERRGGGECKSYGNAVTDIWN